MKKTAIKIVKIVLLILCLFLVSAILVNLILPAFHKKPDASYEETLSALYSETEGSSKERIRSIDENEEALLWRLRMIASAKESVILTTFDLRPDESGTDVMAALYQAAESGVQVKVLLDGIYEPVYLSGSDTFHALCAHENVEVRFYNPISLKYIYRVNYRMHDKYLIIDDKMYLLGGRNTNDIFLGNYQEGINIDREILVYEEEPGMGTSFQQLMAYFETVWKDPCVQRKTVRMKQATAAQIYSAFEERYKQLLDRYSGAAEYAEWQEDTYPANQIVLLSNPVHAGNKSPQLLSAIQELCKDSNDIVIQTPYVICDSYMYSVLAQMEETAEVRILLNAVERGSNPWGCTDYLNNRDKILAAGADVYEVMNEHALHTKTILIDDHISVVGSYNFDMRSTYLDTELMLVIDSEELNQYFRDMAETYIDKSKEVLSDGSQSEGVYYEAAELPAKKQFIYQILRVLIRPFRHLL